MDIWVRSPQPEGSANVKAWRQESCVLQEWQEIKEANVTRVVEGKIGEEVSEER